MAQGLEAKEFRLTGVAEDGNLTLCVKRYTPIITPEISDGSVTLLLAHCVGAHKEHWEPTLVHLFNEQRNRRGPGGVVVREAWALDSPNHGDAAVANETKLLKMRRGISGQNWGRAFKLLLTSGLIPKTNLVAIGHSAGVAPLILSTLGFSLDNLPFKSMILVEPPMMTRAIFAKAFREPTHLAAVIESTRTKRDVWSSRDDAMVWLKARNPWKRWHPDVLRIFVDQGLQDLPTGTYPDHTHGVTLKCTREQEAASYVHYKDAFKSLDRLSQLCSSIPVHCIFGAEIDLVAEETHAGVVDPKEGRKMASITKVANTGHLVAQESPAGLSSAIFTALRRTHETHARL